jgi:hypothetical protein
MAAAAAGGRQRSRWASPRIWHKLAAICLGLMVPLVLTTGFLLAEQSIRIRFAEKELHGDAYLRPLSRLLEDLTLHRTVVRRLAAGEESATRAGEIAGRVDRDLERLLDVDGRLRTILKVTPQALSARGSSEALPARLLDGWAAIKSAPPGAARTGELHTALIADVRDLIVYVGDTSNLILDPDLDTGARTSNVSEASGSPPPVHCPSVRPHWYHSYTPASGGPWYGQSSEQGDGDGAGAAAVCVPAGLGTTDGAGDGEGDGEGPAVGEGVDTAAADGEGEAAVCSRKRSSASSCEGAVVVVAPV